ncbi:PadR family transcriptional regulator [Micromonospora noduli]|uniref:PadR family transcriptional regulator n=1 Tax=Micromonospora noduli TaxID=709876 RepID=UPI000DD86192|nr:PadR family transcriptional regulator [Micromonospora noduli]
MTRPSTPMREPTYFILAALQDEPLHGYAIVKRAQELSDGRVRLTTGTLYAALDRLNGEEMVRVAEETVVNGRARRTYELTERGLSALHEEAARLIAAARVVRDRSVRSTAATVRTAPA